MKSKFVMTVLVVIVITFMVLGNAQPQESRARYEMMKLIQKEKFDLVLPGAMRDNGIDMWIHVMQDGIEDPLTMDLGGRAHWSMTDTLGLFIFTDRGGDRIERAVLGGEAESDLYDIFGAEAEITKFVAERDPRRIAVNMSTWVPSSNGLTHTGYLRLVKLLGDKYAKRLVTAENLIRDFRIRRVQTEVIAYAKACEIQRQIMEQALRNIKPGKTTREDIHWWTLDRLLAKGLAPTPTGSTTPGLSHSESDRSETRNPGYVFQRGDLLSWDMGIEYLNFGTDYKRKAYILKEGETDIPAGLKRAWERVLKAREIIKKNIKVGITAGETLKVLARALEKEGYVYTPFVNYGAQDRKIINALGDDERSGVSIDCHCVGNYGFSQIVEGPSISPFRHDRASILIQQNNLFAFEFMVHTWVPEWGRRHSINLEDNAIVTEKGVEFLYPPNERIILIR